MKFREHRGGAADSMATEVEVSNRGELLEHIRKLAKEWPAFPPVTDASVHIEEYAGGTFIVTMDGYGLLGYTDGVLPTATSPIKQLLQAETEKHELIGHLPREVGVMYREALADLAWLETGVERLAALAGGGADLQTIHDTARRIAERRKPL